MSEHPEKPDLMGAAEDRSPEALSASSPELPPELAALARELQSLTPASTDLSGQQILAEADRDPSVSAQQADTRKLQADASRWRSSWSTLVATALVSAGMTALAMTWLRPSPQSIEKIRVVRVPAEAENEKAGVGSNPNLSGAETETADLPEPSDLAWYPVTSRANVIRQVDRLLRLDADRTTPSGAAFMEADNSEPTPSFRKLQLLLDDPSGTF